MSAASIEKFIAKLRFCEDVPQRMVDEINAVADKALEEMAKEAAEFLHNDLNDEEHTEEQVKAIIVAFPDSLSVRDRSDCLPVQHAAFRSSAVLFVPLLAKEGMRLGVGGEGSRGGLLTETRSTLEDLVYNDNDEKCKHVMEKLRELDLFKKEDIQTFNLLHHFLCDDCVQRFEMLAAWDPELFRRSASYNKPPLYHILDELLDGTFEMVLKTRMEHFPEMLGFLFQKYEGKAACEFAFDSFGTDEAMSIICRCIPRGENHSILHMAIEANAPHLEDKLMKYYHDESFIRDATGRTLSQVYFHTTLRKRNTSFSRNASIFVKSLDDQIETKDPHSGLYPFMLAASDNMSDLDAVNYLVRRCPKVLAIVINTDTSKHNAEGLHNEGRRKRQRQLT